jgi:uncharacterized repeat protein (TIGR01451 family)
MKPIQTVLLIALFTVFATSAFANAPDGLELRTVAEIERTVTTPEGETQVVRTDAGRVTPGTEVIYSVFYTNSGDAPAEDVVITNPVPEHMVCVAIEPDARSQVTVSVDGGAQFDSVETLHVVDESGRARPAEVGDCTHIRWNFSEPLAPGSEGVVSFRAVLQ